MKVGYNKQTITPNFPVQLAGYNRTKKSKGSLDPIEINSIAIEIDGNYRIISILDSIIIEDSVISQVKEILLKKYNLKKECITIGCIHTHSAPAYFKPFFENVPVESRLQMELIGQFCDSIMNAYTKLENATVVIKRTMIEGLYGNRNVKDAYSDKAFIDFQFKKHNGEDMCSLITMACHPTILNGNNLYLSADLIGAIRQEYKNIYNRDCMIVNGCCGDVSTRFYRNGTGIEELHRFTKNIMKQIENYEILNYSFSKIKNTQIIKNYTYYADDDFISEKLKSLKGKTDELSKMLYKNLLLKKEKSPMTLKLISNITIFGNIIFISLPGDITSKLGKRIKDAFKDYLVILCCYCENYSNYFVSNEDYGKYFETYITRLEKGNADDFINDIILETKRLL